jgi:hypothetical protein
MELNTIKIIGAMHTNFSGTCNDLKLDASDNKCDNYPYLFLPIKKVGNSVNSCNAT